MPVPEVAGLAELNELLGCCIREIEMLGPLPASPFPTWEQSTHRVNQRAMITVRRNHYSVPVRLVGRKVAARVGAREIEVLANGDVVARHPWLRGSQLRSVRLDHYLELLKNKPGASDAARQIVDVLMLCRDHDPEIVELAVRGALAAGAIDGRAVELPDRLAQHQRPAPSLGEYNQLLDGEAVGQ